MNRIIIEWASRIYRARPKLLRHTIPASGLEPFIYDKASYEAFSFEMSRFRQEDYLPTFMHEYSKEEINKFPSSKTVA